MSELEQVKEIIKKAGSTVLGLYTTNTKISYKEGGSPVTEADIASEKVILDGLKEFNYGIVSEETSEENDRHNKKRVWIIDPLDGTKGFIKKTGDFTIMIGLVEDGQPILGAVYQPTIDVLYYATVGNGAFKETAGEKQSLEVTKKTQTSELSLLVSRDHLRPTEIAVADKLSITDFKQRGSAGLKASLVAEGVADLYMNTSDKTGEYDICAADIIVTEAGGTVTDMSGDQLQYNKDITRNLNGFVVSNGQFHDQIIDTLNSIPKQ